MGPKIEIWNRCQSYCYHNNQRAERFSFPHGRTLVILTAPVFHPANHELLKILPQIGSSSWLTTNLSENNTFNFKGV
jgi:hypothetical protein